jgi:hypothetical protein
LRWGGCERLTRTFAGGQPRCNGTRIGIRITVSIGCSHCFIYRGVHIHPGRDRPVDRATRSVGDVEEHPLGIRAVDALHRGGPVAHTVPRT